jgi:hypothetical protein
MDTLHQQQAGAGWVYRDSARALVGAAYAAAH